jgi:DNA-binding NtrC family response regulator
MEASMADLLVVDDDLDLADMYSDILSWKGHAVRLARNGEEGLAQIRKAFPDLILCDVEMPLLTGPEMAYRMFLRDAGQEKIPILLTSGVRDLWSVAEQVGTPYFLAKPFTVERLLAMVERALTERTAPTPHL